MGATLANAGMGKVGARGTAAAAVATAAVVVAAVVAVVVAVLLGALCSKTGTFQE